MQPAMPLSKKLEVLYEKLENAQQAVLQIENQIFEWINQRAGNPDSLWPQRLSQLQMESHNRKETVKRISLAIATIEQYIPSNNDR